MNRYVAFLRGINLGPHKKMGMGPLKEVVEALGGKEVQTYLQSGNVVFSSEIESPGKLDNIIREGIHKKFGFDVPVKVLGIKHVEEILTSNPFLTKPVIDKKQLYYVVFFSPPKKELLASLRSENSPHESFELTEYCAYLQCRKGYGKAKINNNFFEKKLGVSATTRNNRTLHNLLDLLGD